METRESIGGTYWYESVDLVAWCEGHLQLDIKETSAVELHATETGCFIGLGVLEKNTQKSQTYPQRVQEALSWNTVGHSKMRRTLEGLRESEIHHAKDVVDRLAAHSYP